MIIYADVPGGLDRTSRLMGKITYAALIFGSGNEARVVGRLADHLIAAAPDMFRYLRIGRIVAILFPSQDVREPGIVVPVHGEERCVIPLTAASEKPVDGVGLVSGIPAEP